MVTWNDLTERVNENSGLATATLGELREAAGFGKLGRYVLVEIRNGLGKSALGAFPGKLLDQKSNPDMNQHQWVRIFGLGTAIERLVKAVESPDHIGDQELLERASSGEADKLIRIRAIVCDGA